jgi:hypothetical protein
MPKGVYERKPKEDQMASNEAPQVAVSSEKMFPVLLTKNYVPKDKYEIVGYLKEAVKAKDAAGNMKIIEPEEFIEGVMKPHTSPGVGFGEMIMKDGQKVNAKIWAGTHIKIPLEEAKYVVSKKIAERADAISA